MSNGRKLAPEALLTPLPSYRLQRLAPPHDHAGPLLSFLVYYAFRLTTREICSRRKVEDVPPYRFSSDALPASFRAGLASPHDDAGPLRVRGANHPVRRPEACRTLPRAPGFVARNGAADLAATLRSDGDSDTVRTAALADWVDLGARTDARMAPA